MSRYKVRTFKFIVILSIVFLLVLDFLYPSLRLTVMKCWISPHLGAGRSLENSIKVYKELSRQPISRKKSFRSDSGSEVSSELEEKCVATVPAPLYRHHHCPLYTILKKPKQICDYDTDLFITIITSAKNHQSRKVLRKTILSPFIGETRLKYVFLVGQSSSHEKQNQLSSECEHYDDIVVGNFFDHYDNLTIKSLFMLKLAATHCSSARFIMKLDDDVVINIASVYEQLYNKPYHHAIYGRIHDYSTPHRQRDHKWYGNYIEKFYPRYVSGPVYILSTDLAVPIYMAAMAQPFLRLEDVFITGICAKHSNIDDLRFICADFKVSVKKISDVSLGALAVHSHNLTQFQDLWEKLLDT